MDEMRCPCCNSWDCDHDENALMFKEGKDGIWAYYMAWCHTCNLAFVYKKWFEHLDYYYECISLRELEKEEGRAVRTKNDTVTIDMLTAHLCRCRSLTTRMDDRKMAERLDELLEIVYEYANKRFSEE